MSGLVVIWGLIFLSLRKAGVYHPLWLSGVIPSSDFSPMDIDTFSQDDCVKFSRYLWHNTIYYFLAFTPLYLGWATERFAVGEVSLQFLSILILYFLLNLLALKLLKSGSLGILGYFLALHSRVAKLFLPLLSLEDSMNRFFLGSIVHQRIINVVRMRLVKQSQERALKEDEQELEQGEREILHQLDGLFYTPMRSVMTPRSRVVTMPPDWQISEALNNAALHGLSRYPVLDDDEAILGIFRANQLVLVRDRKMLVAQKLDDEISLDADLSCYQAMEILQKAKRQLGIVYRGKDWIGLVTLEDLLEEFVGEIEDEFDESFLKKTSSEDYLVNAAVSLNQLREYFSEPFPKKRVRTLNGFLIAHFGKPPKVGEELTLEAIKLTVLESDSTKVQRVRIQKKKN
jgi:putative hemolysin